jgi:hypothetical protein
MDSEQYKNTLLAAISYPDSQHILTGYILRLLDDPTMTFEQVKPFVECLDDSSRRANMQYFMRKATQYNVVSVECGLWDLVPETNVVQCINAALNGAIKGGHLELIAKYYEKGGEMDTDYMIALLTRPQLFTEAVAKYLIEKEPVFFQEFVKSKRSMRSVDYTVRTLIGKLLKNCVQFKPNVY